MKFSIKEFFVHEGGNYKSSTSGKAKSSHGSGQTGRKSSTNVQINIGEAAGGFQCPFCGEMHPEKFCPETREYFEPESGIEAGPFQCPFCGEMHPEKFCPETREYFEPDGLGEARREEMDPDDWRDQQRDYEMDYPESERPPLIPADDPATDKFERDYMFRRVRESTEFQLKMSNLLKIEKKLSSYEHPRTHLAKKFSKQKGVKDPWALAQHVASQNEHQDPTQRKDIGSTAWSSPSQEVDVKKFFNHDGNLHIEDIDEGGKGSGRKKGSKNKPKSSAQVTPGKQVDMSSLPSSDDDIDALMSQFGNEPAPKDDSPFSREEGDLTGAEDEFSFLDDPNYGAGTQLPAREPKSSKKSAVAAPGPEVTDEPVAHRPEFPEMDMSWEEFRGEYPDSADDIETELGDVSTAQFAHKGAFDYMITDKGERWKGSAAAGWLPYDDGQSPAGEF